MLLQLYTQNINIWDFQTWPKLDFDACVSWPPTAAELWRVFVSPDAFSIKPACKHKLMVCRGRKASRTDNHPTPPSSLLYNLVEISFKNPSQISLPFNTD